MFEAISYFLYELLHTQQLEPIWREKIYVPTFIWGLLFTTLLMVIIYYYVLNVVSAKFNNLKWWMIFMGINALIVLIITITISVDKGELINKTDSAFLSFCLINVVYSVLFYFIYSMILKWGSPNGRVTPF